MAVSHFVWRAMSPLATTVVFGAVCALARSAWQRKKRRQETINLFHEMTRTKKLIRTKPPPTPEWKKQLPPPLNTHPWLERNEIHAKSTTEGAEHVTEVFLLGVAHGSKKSAESVQALLNAVKPDTIFIELCVERLFGVLRSKDVSFPLLKSIKFACGQGLGVKDTLVLICHAYLQQLVTSHGSGRGEFRAALEYAKSQRDNQSLLVLLGDRPISITMGRLADRNKAPSGVDKRFRRLLKKLYGDQFPLPPDNIEEMETQGAAKFITAWKQRKSLLDFFVQGVVENEDLLSSNMSGSLLEIHSSGELCSGKRRLHGLQARGSLPRAQAKAHRGCCWRWSLGRNEMSPESRNYRNG